MKITVTTICALLFTIYWCAMPTASADRASNPFKPSAQKPRTSPKHKATRPSARLSVQFKALMPVHSIGKIWEGKLVNISFEVKNVGTAPSGPGATYTVKCLVLSGSPNCAVANTTGPLPAIAPGGSKSIALFGAKPAKPGKYRIVISANPGARGRPATQEFTVVSKRKLRRVPRRRIR